MRLGGLFVYPIKGCGGVALERAQLGRYGLDHDRHWMVVDEADRVGLTQRTVPALARIRPRLGDDGSLVLGADGVEPLAVARPATADTKARPTSASTWSTPTSAHGWPWATTCG